MATIITVPHLIMDGGISLKDYELFQNVTLFLQMISFLELIISIVLLDSKNQFHKTIMFLIQVDS